MLEPSNNSELPPIPGKRYFTIGEVSDLCGVKPHVLRYWEQEFPQLKPVKRRGNRRYYQRQDVLDHSANSQPAVRAGLYDWRSPKPPHGRRCAGGSQSKPAAHPSDAARARRADQDSAPLGEWPPLGGHGFQTPPISAIIRSSVGAWRSLVAHLHGVQGVASSNLVAPTN